MQIIKQRQDNRRDYNRIIGTTSDNGKLLKAGHNSTWLYVERVHGSVRREEGIVYSETKQDVKPSVKTSEPKARKTTLQLFQRCPFRAFSDERTQFIAPTKRTVVIIHKCQWRTCDMFRYKCSIFRENKVPALKPPTK